MISQRMLPYILTFIAVVDAASGPPTWSSDKTIVVPLTQREGHAYYFKYDYKAKANKHEYTGVAVLYVLKC
ncbi:hypothetical protein Y032_0222g2609 [Ancylostoma ceylanicum]|uniref:Uncharacterized protein n=1 Tax=Ancylostoma ceylanicum TaxID=53326 RepID=A0A016SHW5_9BILA|nr:hypothetical protein Y032_0222g2609 [Ancylostoma ceylanicum]